MEAKSQTHQLVTLLPPEMRKVERTKMYWDVKSNFLTESPPGKKGDGESMHFGYEFLTSETYSLGATVGKPSNWKLVLNPCFMDNGIRYISLSLAMEIEDEINNNQTKFVDVCYSLKLISGLLGEMTILCEKTSGIRRFCPRPHENCFGWDRFFPCEKFGSNPPDVIQFLAEIEIFSDPQTDPKEIQENIELHVEGKTLTTNDTIWDPPLEAVEKFCKTNGNRVPQNTNSTNANLRAKPSDFEDIFGDKLNESDKEKSKENKLHWKKLAGIWNNGNPKFPDSFIRVNDRIFNVHVDIVSGICPDLAKKFLRTKGDGSPLPVAMQDVTEGVMENLIEYFYTGTLYKLNSESLNTADMNELLKTWELAVMYRLEELDKLFCRVVLSSVTHLNFKKIYQLMYQRKGQLSRERYSMTEFLCHLKRLRKENPEVMKDYESCRSEYAKLIFQM